MRGPCPGLNTLASHGYLPRNGIVTPTQIINAVQDGFGMDDPLAVQLAYTTMLVDGNPLMNLMTISGKSSLTGPDPPKPAIVGGVDTHAVLEGDASMTHVSTKRYSTSNHFGGGSYNLTVATEYRFYRIQQSVAENPTFSFISPRIVTAYGEAAVPFVFFVDGRKADGQLSIEDALQFFRDGCMPDDFHRADGLKAFNLVENSVNAIFAAHPVQPGGNNGTVNSHTLDPNSAGISDTCKGYTDFVNVTARSLYPNPQVAFGCPVTKCFNKGNI
ncbi:hypothetical protein M422DRAFT_257470 [Sphaerobolus stellatus SS14]|uniref:Heme haloperoxidase family profile domain-containing protein n=1 Tax=Sphaerobolus stellatus (strain SS14) TaxID=990650 RepID=A0A0C9VE05_SPHS4|nr:hypothetical protein M422DRAFT_257470 [Sphaerobolus stellatus SS14]